MYISLSCFFFILTEMMENLVDYGVWWTGDGRVVCNKGGIFPKRHATFLKIEWNRPGHLRGVFYAQIMFDFFITFP